MVNYDVLLFNEEDKQQLVQKVNQVLRLNGQSFTLTIADVEQILDSREQAMLDHHLIDFSLNNLVHFMEGIAKRRRMSKSEYLNIVEVLQESFYYLHSIHPAEDERLLEIIWRLYEKFDGNLEYIQGYIEDFPGSKGDE